MNVKDSNSSMALHPACAAVFKDVALMLLTKDAEPNPLIHRGHCPLDLAWDQEPWEFLNLEEMRFGSECDRALP